jgi:hypothetical protein
MRCTVPDPTRSADATLSMPTPLASIFRTLRSVAASIRGGPSGLPFATDGALKARLHALPNFLSLDLGERRQMFVCSSGCARKAADREMT